LAAFAAGHALRMQPGGEFTLETARAAANEAGEDALARWVGAFLASRGSNNATLAAALAQDRHWWMGPLRVPLRELVRLAGPEDEALCAVEPDEWEGDVDAMQDSLDGGWQPPPLLAEYQDGRLLLQDGNHRYEALWYRRVTLSRSDGCSIQRTHRAERRG
jgi:hypothetical protein